MSQKKINLVLTLADGDMAGLHQEFIRLGNSVTQEEFIDALRKFCPSIAELARRGQSDVVEHLFFHVDMNGDGRVSWDDLFDFSVGTANERLQTLPAERVRSYTFSRTLPRVDNVLLSAYYPDPDLLLLSSRHVPIQLVRANSFKLAHQFTPEDVGGPGVLPRCAAFMSGTETLAAFFSDMKLRLWSSIDRAVPTPAKPLPLEHSISRLRTVPTINPMFLMGCDTSGAVLTIEASKQALSEPRVRSSVGIHDPLQGGAADFCVWKPIETRIITSGYDNTLMWTDLVAMRSTLVGVTPSVLRRTEYFEGYQCIIAAGHDNVVTSWVTHQSQKPCTTFEDPSRPHTCAIVGLECIPNSSQVISCDVSGMVKIWDVRKFRCVQTLRAVEGFNAEAESGVCTSMDDDSVAVSVNSFCYLESTREICSVVSSGAHFHAYDRGGQPQVAAQLPVSSVRYNPLSHAIVTLSSTLVQIWDADVGHLQSEIPKTCKEDMTVMTLDGVGRRMFLGTQSGDVEVKSYDGATTLKVMKLHRGEVTGMEYSLMHRALVSVGVDGFLTVVVESDTSSPPQRLRLSNKPIHCLALAPELSLIAAGGKNGTTFLMDILPPRNEESELKYESSVHCVCFLSPFPILVTGHANGDVLFWTVRPIKDEALILTLNLKKQQFVPQWGSVSAEDPHAHHYEAPNGKAAQQQQHHPHHGTTSPTSTPGGVVLTKLKRHGSVSGFANQVKQTTTSQGTDKVPQAPLHGRGSSNAPPQRREEDSLLFEALSSSLGATQIGAVALDMASSMSLASTMSNAVSGGDIHPSCIAFDRVTHHLFVATNKGRVHIWKMCPLLQALDLPACAYPQTLPFSIRERLSELRRGGDALRAAAPVCVATVHAHKDDIVDMQMIPTLDVLITCGEDHRVLILDAHGNRLAELSQGRLPVHDEDMLPIHSDSVSQNEEDGGNETVNTGDVGGSDPSQLIGSSSASVRRSAHRGSSASGAPGSNRRSRRPEVDKLLRSVFQPPAPQPNDFHECDGQSIMAFDIHSSSPNRHQANHKSVSVAVSPTSSKKRRKPSLMSRSAIGALLNSEVQPLGSKCIHGQLFDATMLDDEIHLSQPQPKHKGKRSTSPQKRRSPTKPKGDPDQQARSGIAKSEVTPISIALDASDTRHPQDDHETEEGNTSPPMHSHSSSTQGTPTLEELGFINASAALGMTFAVDQKFVVTAQRKRFSPRLHPKYKPLDASAESNERHLTTLLRNLGDFSRDWDSVKLFSRRKSHCDSRMSASQGDANGGGDDAIRRQQKVLPEAKDSFSTPPSSSAPPLSSRVKKNSARLEHNQKGSGKEASSSSPPLDHSSKDDVDNSQKKVATCSTPSSAPEDISWRPPKAVDQHSLRSNIHEMESKQIVIETAAVPSATVPPICEDNLLISAVDAAPEPDTDLAPPSGRRNTAMPPPARPSSSSSSSFPSMFQRGRHSLPPQKNAAAALLAETRLTVPDVSGPLETLQLLHTAWNLAHYAGGTPMHYLGLQNGFAPAEGPPGSAVSSARQSRSAGGFSSSSRGGSGGNVRLGITRLGVPPPSTSSSPPHPAKDNAPEKAAGGRELNPLAICMGASSRTISSAAADRNLPLIPKAKEQPPHWVTERTVTAGGDTDTAATGNMNVNDRISPRRIGTASYRREEATHRVGIHAVSSPRAQSGNIYESRVHHGHVPLGAPSKPPRQRNPKPDSKSIRIALLEDELKRCLVRRPAPPSDVAWEPEARQAYDM